MTLSKGSWAKYLGHKPSKRKSLLVCAATLNTGYMDFGRGRILFSCYRIIGSSCAGMARLDHPEMFPATLDRFAEPIPEDVGNLVHYRKLLADTQLEKAPLVVAFDTVVDGWTMKRFGEKVYTLGATLLVLELSDIPCVIGGYNPRGWIGLNEDRDSMAAFLFSWPDGDISKSPIKLAKRGGASLAVMDYPNEGIKFGPDGLKCMVPGKEKMVSSRLGPYYDTMPDGLRTLWPGGEKVQQVNRIVAYVSAQGPETYQLDGIVWKTGRAESE